jgi:hypothetical protein
VPTRASRRNRGRTDAGFARIAAVRVDRGRGRRPVAVAVGVDEARLVAIAVLVDAVAGARWRRWLAGSASLRSLLTLAPWQSSV